MILFDHLVVHIDVITHLSRKDLCDRCTDVRIIPRIMPLGRIRLRQFLDAFLNISCCSCIDLIGF